MPMGDPKVSQPPVFPPGKKRDSKKRNGIHESDVTSLAHCMLEVDSIRGDRRAAWKRWRNDPPGLQR